MSYPTEVDLAAIGEFLKVVAGERWLQSEELFMILMMSGEPNRIGIPVLSDPVKNPQSKAPVIGSEVANIVLQMVAYVLFPITKLLKRMALSG